MGERLRARDLAFLNAETPEAPRHHATVEVFDPAVMTQFSPALNDVAAEARTRLSGMMSALTSDAEDPDAARA